MGVSQDEVVPASVQRQQALLALDDTWGPLSIGETAISRVALDHMGVRLGNGPVSLDRLGRAQADQRLIDQVGVSGSHFKTYLASASSEASSLASGVLFELASLRSVAAPALLRGGDAADATLMRLERLLCSVQRVNLNDTNRVQSLPGWADKVRSGSYQTVGAGLQLYGFYSAIRGIGEAIRTGDSGALLFEGGAFTAEVLSLGVEVALERAGAKMIDAAHTVYHGFRASRAGLLLMRGAGLMAAVLTLPFDIAQAVTALSTAVKSEGKVAQDLYVEAGLSLAGAALSMALGAAALAGFSAAGPVGLVASAFLIIGARGYAAARVVDDIDDYIELSTRDRLRTGWFAFVGVDLDESVLDRYTVARARSAYAQALKNQARALLDGELKDSVQAIVNGRFTVRLQTLRHWKHAWDEAAGEKPYADVREPAVEDVDDYFDARRAGAINALPEAHWGTKGPEKGVVWLLGGGHDTVMGVPGSPNHFRYAGGAKYLLGGNVDDEFVFEVPRDTFSATGKAVYPSTVIGGTGTDTLNLAGEPEGWGRAGFNVNLGAGTVHLIADSTRHGLKCMGIWGIENISTLPGASSVVTGSADANRIVMQGEHDSVDAQAGDDQLLILGPSARVDGGPGADYYEVSARTREVVIVEDGQQQSLILLNWPFNRIQRWWVAGTELKVASTSGPDGESPGPTVTVEEVYRLREGKHHLANRLLRFLSSDGYRMTPLLPEELDAQGALEVSVEVIAPPGASVSPTFLGAGQSVALTQASHDYFVGRGVGESVIDASASTDTARCCLYVDYDSHELSGVYTRYHVATRRERHFDYLDYTRAEINFVMVDGRVLSLRGYAAQPAASWTSVGGSLQGAAFKPRAACVIVMRDGVSYRVMPPVQSYLSDHTSPGPKRLDGAASLSLRYGHAAFFTPQRAKSINLTTRSQRVVLGEPPHPNRYVLSGQGGVYEIELRSWATIELVTPGAEPQQADGSKWILCCSGLVEDVDLDNIAFENGQLRIGSVSVQVHALVDPDAPVEHIQIHARQGLQYDVRLDLEKVFIASVVAAAGRTVDELLNVLRHGRQRSSVFTPFISVSCLSLNDGGAGAVCYDVVADRWTLVTDKARTLSSEQLSIS